MEPAGLGASLGERHDEARAIRIVPEDWLAPAAAIHDVDRAGILDSQLGAMTGEWSAPLHVSISRTRFRFRRA